MIHHFLKHVQTEDKEQSENMSSAGNSSQAKTVEPP